MRAVVTGGAGGHGARLVLASTSEVYGDPASPSRVPTRSGLHPSESSRPVRRWLGLAYTKGAGTASNKT